MDASEVSALARVDALKPSQSDVKSLPGATVTESADGTYTVDIKGRAGIEALRELRKPYGEASARLGAERNEKVPTVTVQHPNGTVQTLPAAQERSLAARGFRPRITGRRTRITSESEIRARMAQEAETHDLSHGAGMHPYDRED